MAVSSGNTSKAVAGSKRSLKPPGSTKRAGPLAGAPFERILVATDFSAPAGRAVGRALRLPLSENASITLLHVIPLGIPSKFEKILWADAKKTLAQSTAAAAETAKNIHGRPVRISSDIVRGKPSFEILERARREQSELVVLGRHGRRGIRELFLGSTAERVVRVGSVPALVVLHPPAQPYKTPIVALDGSDASRKVLEQMLRVVVAPVKIIDTVTAYEIPFENILTRAGVPLIELVGHKAEARKADWNMIQRVIGAYRKVVPWNTVLRAGDPRRVVIEEVTRVTHDLVALGRRGRTKLPQLLLGNVAEALLRAAPSDMLFGPLDRSDFELP